MYSSRRTQYGHLTLQNRTGQRNGQARRGWHVFVIPVFMRPRQEDRSEFEASPGHIACSKEMQQMYKGVRHYIGEVREWMRAAGWWRARRAGGMTRGGVDNGRPRSRIPGRLPFIKGVSSVCLPQTPAGGAGCWNRGDRSRGSRGSRQCWSLARRWHSRYARRRGDAGPACLEPRPGPGLGPPPQVCTPPGRHAL